MSKDRSALILAAVLALAGTVHFVRPATFDDLVPELLPGSARDWVYGSGVAELAVAAALAAPRTRRFGAGAAVVLFVLVFPGNLKMAWDYRHRAGAEQAAAYARLPLQVPLILWALRIRRRTAR